MTVGPHRGPATDTTRPAHRAERSAFGAALAAVLPGVALSTVLTAWHYDSKPMWRDEWFTYGTAGRTLPQMAHLLSSDDGGLAGFYLVMHAWMSLGDSLAWVRLPAALATVAIAALTALVGARLGGTLVGALSGVVVAVLPSVTDHAQEARAYPLVVAAVTATALAALRYRDEPSRGRGAVLCALAAAGVVLHPLPGAPAVAGIVVGLLASPGLARRAVVVVTAAPAALLALGLVSVGASQGGESSNPGGVHSLGFVLRLRFAVAPSWVLLVALVALSLVGTAFLVRSRPGRTVLVLAWVGFPVVVIVTSILLGSFSESRYLAASVPAAAVLVSAGAVAVGGRLTPRAAGVVEERRRDRRAASALAVVVVVVLVVAYLPHVAELRRSPYMNDDPRAAGRYLDARARRGDAVVYSGSMARPLTEHYAPVATTRLDDALLAVPPVAAGSISGREVPAADRRATVADARRVWVVGTLSSTGWRFQSRVDDVTGGFEEVERRSFGGWTVERWDRVAPSSPATRP